MKSKVTDSARIVIERMDDSDWEKIRQIAEAIYPVVLQSFFESNPWQKTSTEKNARTFAFCFRQPASEAIEAALQFYAEMLDTMSCPHGLSEALIDEEEAQQEEARKVA